MIKEKDIIHAENKLAYYEGRIATWRERLAYEEAKLKSQIEKIEWMKKELKNHKP